MRFPWKLFFFFVFATIGGIIAYDSYRHGSFKKSQTAHYLDEAGVLVYLDQAYHRARVYTNKGWQWCQVNVPVYYKKTCDFAGPYLALFWEKLCTLGEWIVEVTKEQRAWLNKKIPELLDWIETKAPGLCDAVSHYLSMIWEHIVFATLWLWHHIVHYSHIVWHWLLENVLTGSLSPDNIMQHVSATLTTVQSYIVHGAQWVLRTVNESMTETTEGSTGANTSPPIKAN